jgi:hypothetical protein
MEEEVKEEPLRSQRCLKSKIRGVPFQKVSEWRKANLQTENASRYVTVGEMCGSCWRLHKGELFSVSVESKKMNDDTRNISKRRTMIKDRVGCVRSTTRNLPEPSHTFGMKSPPDPEGAGEGTPSTLNGDELITILLF